MKYLVVFAFLFFMSCGVGDRYIVNPNQDKDMHFVINDNGVQKTALKIEKDGDLVGIGDLDLGGGVTATSLDVGSGTIETTGPIEGASFKADNGSNGDPAYGFKDDIDTDTGIRRSGEDQLDLVTDGDVGLRISADRKVLVRDGGATSPGLGFINDPDTGIYGASNNNLYMTLGGVLGYRFGAGFMEARGTVSTPSPYIKLVSYDDVDNQYTGEIRWADKNHSSRGIFSFSHAGDLFEWYIGGYRRMYLDTNELILNGDSNFSLHIQSATNSYESRVRFGYGSTYSRGSIRYTHVDDKFHWGAGANSNRMILDSLGNLGIAGGLSQGGIGGDTPHDCTWHSADAANNSDIAYCPSPSGNQKHIYAGTCSNYSGGTAAVIRSEYRTSWSWSCELQTGGWTRSDIMCCYP